MRGERMAALQSSSSRRGSSLFEQRLARRGTNLLDGSPRLKCPERCSHITSSTIKGEFIYSHRKTGASPSSRKNRQKMESKSLSAGFVGTEGGCSLWGGCGFGVKRRHTEGRRITVNTRHVCWLSRICFSLVKKKKKTIGENKMNKRSFWGRNNRPFM